MDLAISIINVQLAASVRLILRSSAGFRWTDSFNDLRFLVTDVGNFQFSSRRYFFNRHLFERVHDLEDAQRVLERLHSV